MKRKPSGPLAGKAAARAPKRSSEAARMSEEISRQLAAARKRVNLSQRALAKLLGTSQAQVHRLENPQHGSNHSIDTIARLAAAMGYRFVVSLEPLQDAPRRSA